MKTKIPEIVIALSLLTSCSQDIKEDKSKKKAVIKEVSGHNCHVRYVDTSFRVGDTMSFPDHKSGAKQYVVIR